LKISAEIAEQLKLEKPVFPHGFGLFYAGVMKISYYPLEIPEAL